MEMQNGTPVCGDEYDQGEIKRSVIVIRGYELLQILSKNIVNKRNVVT